MVFMSGGRRRKDSVYPEAQWLCSAPPQLVLTISLRCIMELTSIYMKCFQTMLYMCPQTLIGPRVAHVIVRMILSASYVLWVC